MALTSPRAIYSARRARSAPPCCASSKRPTRLNSATPAQREIKKPRAMPEASVSSDRLELLLRPVGRGERALELLLLDLGATLIGFAPARFQRRAPGRCLIWWAWLRLGGIEVLL